MCNKCIDKANNEMGSFYVKWCKIGHHPSQNLMRVCKIVTKYNQGCTQIVFGHTFEIYLIQWHPADEGNVDLESPRLLQNSHQKQPFADAFQNRCSWKFDNFHMKTPVSESLFNKVAGLTICKVWQISQENTCVRVSFGL